MRRFIPLFLGICLPIVAHAAREGTPIWYGQPARSTTSGNQIVGQREFVYQVPRAPAPQQQPIFVPNSLGTMTPAGIGFTQQPDWLVSADYTRRFAEFEFKTGVNSILKWNDMIIDEVGIRVDHNFNLRDVNLFAYGEYRVGNVSSGGLSMDYDLEPYDWSYPNYGIFTISMGGLSGGTDYLRLGFGAKNAWNWSGWQFSPSFGYEIFKHNLQMNDHIYPNPGIYLPLLTQEGDYVFGDASGEFFAVAPGSPINSDWYQVCMSPEDILVAQSIGGVLYVNTDGTLQTIEYSNLWGTLPWGVGPGQCVIIGGDGPIVVAGTTHIYNTTWSGLFVGLEIEKQMTFADKLRFYFQLGMPNYYSEGIWPNRSDWQQNPSFIDSGSNGAYTYQAEMEYTYQVSERMQLALRADTNFFYVGQIPGELYIAGYLGFEYDDFGAPMMNCVIGSSGNEVCTPVIVEVLPQTISINDSLKYAKWQSFGLHLGLKYAF
ncbi:MAG: hypothetical protein FWG39_04005 [Alphaproteobacteria bacterium]|nr:hypothetical protein [Alphaproteobacteria bacterium]